ncbi:MAG: DUF5611 family protein [Halobacteria archaeon]
MKYYKMRRGEHLHDRVPDLQALAEDYFGDVTGTKEKDGIEFYQIEDSLVFEEVLVGVEENSSKKDRLVVHFEEKPVAELAEQGKLELAEDAREAKNNFLEEVTGRDAKARRDSMKRNVEDSDDVDVDAD